MKYICSFILLALCLFSCKTTHPKISSQDSLKKPKNIILLIGDGMGLGQITAGMYANDNKISLEKFPVIGLHKCHAGDKLITDSAAAATAFACGVKTYNGAIGVDMDTVATKSILHEAEEKGLPTGLIATSTIVHATPASFVAHNKYRKNYEEIASDFVKNEVDLWIGGGSKYFKNRTSDDRDLYQELRNKGYFVSDYFESELNDLSFDTDKNFAYLTSLESPLTVDQGRDYLIPATKKSIAYLDKKAGDNGFFMMIEGSQIDWGGHANNSDYVISELLEYDKVIDYVFEWAKKDGETLVLVTADHETGGLAIQKESTMGNIVPAFTTDSHTGVMIPVFAFGPQSHRFAGIYDNTELFYKMKAAYGWE